MFKYFSIFLTLVIHLCESHHYRGGSIYARSLGANSSGSFLEVIVTFTWKRNGYYCDQHTIDFQRLIGPKNDFVYTETGRLMSSDVYCEAFSREEDWSYGRKSITHIVPLGVTSIVAYYEGCCWLSASGESLNWQLRANLSTQLTIGSNEINNSPYAFVPPLLQVRNDVPTVIPIGYIDPDAKDVVKCRWAEMKKSECGGTCGGASLFTLDTNKCTLSVPVGRPIGLYALTIQVEDGIASTPLQFLLQIVQHKTQCSSPPLFSGPTFNSEFYGLGSNELFTYRFSAVTQCANTTITNIRPIGLPGLKLTSGLSSQLSNQWSVDVKWTPKTHSGFYLLCATATDSNRLMAFHCVTLLVGIVPPTMIRSTLRPIGNLLYSDILGSNGFITFQASFNRSIQKPLKSSLIRIFHSNHTLFTSLDVLGTRVQISDKTLYFSIRNLLTNGSFYILFNYAYVCDAKYPRLFANAIYNQSMWTFNVDIKSLSPSFMAATADPVGTIGRLRIGTNKLMHASIQSNRPITLTNLGLIRVYSVYSNVPHDTIDKKNMFVSGNKLTFYVDSEFYTGGYYICIDEAVGVDFSVSNLFTLPLQNKWNFHVDLKLLSPSFIRPSASPQGSLTYNTISSEFIKWSIKLDALVSLSTQKFAYIRIFTSEGISVFSTSLSTGSISLAPDKQTLVFTSQIKFDHGSYYISIDSGICKSLNNFYFYSFAFERWFFNVDYDELAPYFLSETALPSQTLTYEQLLGVNGHVLWSISANRPILKSNIGKNINFYDSNGLPFNISIKNVVANGHTLSFRTDNSFPSGNYNILIEEGIALDAKEQYLRTRSIADTSFWSFNIDYISLAPSYDLGTVSPKGLLDYSYLIRVNLTRIQWSIRLNRQVINCGTSSTLIQIRSLNTNAIVHSISSLSSDVFISVDGLTLNFMTNVSFIGRFYININDAFLCDFNLPWLKASGIKNNLSWTFENSSTTLDLKFNFASSNPRNALTYVRLVQNKNNTITWSVAATRAIMKPYKPAFISVLNSNNQIITKIDVLDSNVTISGQILTFHTSNLFPDGNYSIVFDRGVALDPNWPQIESESFGNWTFTVNSRTLPTLSFNSSSASPFGQISYKAFRGVNNTIEWSIRSIRAITRCPSSTSFIRFFRANNLQLLSIEKSSNLVTISDNVLTFFTNNSFPNGTFYISIDMGFACDADLTSLESNPFNGIILWRFHVIYMTLMPTFNMSTNNPKGNLTSSNIDRTTGNIKWSVTADRPIKLANELAFISFLLRSTNMVDFKIDVASSSLVSIMNDATLVFYAHQSMLKKGQDYYVIFDTGIIYDQEFEFLRNAAQKSSLFWTFRVPNSFVDNRRKRAIQVTTQQSTIAPYDPICSNPRLSIEPPSSSDIQYPIEIKRSKMILVQAYTEIKCNLTLANRKIWQIYNRTSTGIRSLLNLNVPSMFNSRLVIRESYLSAGLYEFVFNVQMLVPPLLNLTRRSSVSTFINVLADGFKLYAFPYKQNEIKIGMTENLILDPLSNSHNPHGFNLSTYNFSYYCRTINVSNEVANDFAKFPTNNSLISLHAYKVDPLLNMSVPQTCFSSVNNYSIFDKKLFINATSLNSSYLYQILMIAQKNNEMHEQYVSIKVLQLSQVQKLILECKHSILCLLQDNSFVVSAKQELALFGNCVSMCPPWSTVHIYEFEMFRQVDSVWIAVPNDPIFFTRKTVTELIIREAFLSHVNTFKVILMCQNNAQNSIEQIFQVNLPPQNGICEVTPRYGYSFSTLFNISCSDWFDLDGHIVEYEFLMKFVNDSTVLSFGYQSESTLITQLPQGPDYDAHRVQIGVRVIDEFGDYTEIWIEDLISIIPFTLLNNTFTSGDMFKMSFKKLFEGNQQELALSILSLAIQLNSDSELNKHRYLISNLQESYKSFITTYGPQMNVSFNVTFDDLKTLDPKYVGYQSDEFLSNITYESNRNTRAQIRDTLATFTRNISVYNVASMRLILSIVYTLSFQHDELTRKTTTQLVAICDLSLKELLTRQLTISYVDMCDLSQLLIGSLANLLLAISNTLSTRQGFLQLDKNDANIPPDYYDTDLENFMNNPNNLALGGDFSPEAMELNKNILMHKTQLQSLMNQFDYTLDALTRILISFKKSTTLQTRSLIVALKQRNLNSINGRIDIGMNRFEIPKICSIYENCETRVSIFERSISFAMAPTLSNGDNETRVSLSSSVDLQYFDENGAPIKLDNFKTPVHIWIPRDPLFTKRSLSFISLDILRSANYTIILFNQTSINSTIHLELYRDSLQSAYLVLFRFLQKLVSTLDEESYDYWKIFCHNSSSSTFFLNLNQTKGYLGLVQFRIRELSQHEINLYCIKTITLNQPPKLSNSTVWSVGFHYVIYSSGCYFYDRNTFKWNSHGMQVLEDSTREYAHCTSTRLATFASGFFMLTTSNRQFTSIHSQNSAVYIVCISLLVFFGILTIWTIYADSQDAKKMSIASLSDNKLSDKFSYKITVFTGLMPQSGTNSKVGIIVNGDLCETDERHLGSASKRRVFHRGGIDCFLMTTSRHLGTLNFIKIWHDNSGRGEMASWFLKYVIIKDLHTGQKFFFLCNKWLAVEKNDGQIECILPVASEIQTNEMSGLLREETKRSLSDSHLWISIFTRPAYSSFTRFHRVTCLMVTLFASMYLNMFYFDFNFRPTVLSSQIILVLGSLTITLEHVAVSVGIHLIILIPILLVKILFKMSSSKRNDLSNDLKRKKYKKMRKFFLFVALLISYLIITASSYALINRSLDFIDIQVFNWSTTLLVSCLISFFIEQPVKVALITFYQTFIRKKSKINTTIDDMFDEKLPIDQQTVTDTIVLKDSYVSVRHLNKEELVMVREKRLEIIHLHKSIKDFLIYTLFLITLYMVSFSNDMNNSHGYKHALSNLFAIDKNFSHIRNNDDLWSWIHNDLLRAIRSEQWYNRQQPFGLAGYLNDRNSRMIGYPVMRQLRVKSQDSCFVHYKFADLINFCHDDYSPSDEDTSNYHYSWMNYNVSYKSSREMDRIYNSFSYRSAANLNGYPSEGDYDTYEGGGYVYEMRGPLIQIRGNISTLKKMQWINRQTRAILFEFSVYNPNVNMLAVCGFLVEYLPSGGLLPTTRIDTLVLFASNNGFSLVYTMFSYVYVVFIVLFALNELKCMIALRINYFCSFWNLVDLCIVLFSIGVGSIYLYKLYESYKVIEFFRVTSGFGYYKMQYVAYWNEWLRYMLAFCAALGTLKFLKFLSFNKIIGFFTLTINKSSRELTAFTCFFAILFVAFVQLIHLTFATKIIGFSTFARSLSSCFQTMLGKFNALQMLDDDFFFGPLVFSLFNVFIVFILLNILVTIISETFSRIRLEDKLKRNEFDMKNFVHEQMNILKNAKKGDTHEYLDFVMYFPIKIDQLLESITRVNSSQIVFLNALKDRKRERGMNTRTCKHK